MTPSRQYRPRVVLVDDNAKVRQALSRLLGLSCEVVASVGDGVQGVETAVRLMPDVMVVDLVMLEMNGLEICRQMKKLAPDTDILLLTASDDEHIEAAAFQAGASAFVAKHDASGMLESTIRRLVEMKQFGP
jgi:two-component system, NarL family, response regulator LiaR